MAPLGFTKLTTLRGPFSARGRVVPCFVRELAITMRLGRSRTSGSSYGRSVGNGVREGRFCAVARVRNLRHEPAVKECWPLVGPTLCDLALALSLQYVTRSVRLRSRRVDLGFAVALPTLNLATSLRAQCVEPENAQPRRYRRNCGEYRVMFRSIRRSTYKRGVL